MKQATVGAPLEDTGRSATDAAMAGGFDPTGAQLVKLPVTLDAEGWRELSRELDRVRKRVPKLEAASRRRLSGAKPTGEIQASVVVMLFETPAEPAD